MTVDDIPGIAFRTFSKDKTQIVCKLNITKGDALDLCRRDDEGNVVNTELRDWLFDKLKIELEECIERSTI